MDDFIVLIAIIYLFWVLSKYGDEMFTVTLLSAIVYLAISLLPRDFIVIKVCLLLFWALLAIYDYLRFRDTLTLVFLTSSVVLFCVSMASILK